MKDNNDDNGKIEENDFGKDGVQSYDYTPEIEKSEDSDLNISIDYIAVPDGKNVILIQTFRTMGTDDEVEQAVDDMLAEVADTFVIE